MKNTIAPGYRADLAELLEGLGGLMADLEDVRDEAQELLDQEENPGVRADLVRMDRALALLSQAADALEEQE